MEKMKLRKLLILSIGTACSTGTVATVSADSISDSHAKVVMTAAQHGCKNLAKCTGQGGCKGNKKTGKKPNVINKRNRLEKV